MMGINNKSDFTTKGGGGEKGLIKSICKDIENEHHWWWTPDIKDCFGSISSRHLGWLPIDRRLIRNIAYLPKCAKIVVPTHKDEEAILQYLHAKHSDLSEDDSILWIISLFRSSGGACFRALFCHHCSHARSSAAKSTLHSLTRSTSVTRFVMICLTEARTRKENAEQQNKR